MELTNKVIWITGASSGIGRALALALARKGARLVLTARREARLEEVGRETGLSDDRFALLPADLSRTAELESLAARAVGIFGEMDILVNNAGISQRSTAAETDPAVMKQIMELDYFAPALLSKFLLPALRSRAESRIVVVSSVVGKFGTQLRSSYSAAKHALHGFFEALRLEEWKNNVGVLLVVAGFIRTEVSINALLADGSPLGRMDRAQLEGISPERAAESIVRAIEKNRQETAVGLDVRARMGLLLSALWPSALFRALRNARVT